MKEHSEAEAVVLEMMDAPQAGVFGVEAEPGKARYLVGVYRDSGSVEWEMFDTVNTTEPDNWPEQFIVLEISTVVTGGKAIFGHRGKEKG